MPEFISIMRYIRDVLYPEASTKLNEIRESSLVLLGLKESIETIKTDMTTYSDNKKVEIQAIADKAVTDNNIILSTTKNSANAIISSGLSTITTATSNGVTQINDIKTSTISQANQVILDGVNQIVDLKEDSLDEITQVVDNGINITTSNMDSTEVYKDEALAALAIAQSSAQIISASTGLFYSNFAVLDGELVIDYNSSIVSLPQLVDGEFILEVE